jgi:hypothetical protein
MKFLFAILLLLLLGLGIWKSMQPAPKPPPVPPGSVSGTRGLNAIDVAEKTRLGLDSLINEQNFHQMGFRSLKEVRQVRPGKPIDRIFLRCDSVAAYTASKGEDISKLVISRQEVIPLKMGDSTRLTVIAAAVPGQGADTALPWDMLEVGNPGMRVLIDSILPLHAQRSKIDKSLYSILEIPALHLTYLSYSTQEGRFLSIVPEYRAVCWPSKDETQSFRLSVVLESLAKCKEVFKACTEPVQEPDSSTSH